MTIEPIPVTFHVRAEPRPELIDAQRRRARPYRVIVQAVAVMAILGLGFGFFAGSILPAPRATLEAGSAPSPQAAIAPPSLAVWRPQAQASDPAPVRQIVMAPASANADPTPVGTIARPSASAFAPVERAPDYAGIRVIAGEQAP